MIDAKNCPCNNRDWYDVTDIATGQKGMNTKICVNLNCKEDCNRQITENGYPFYDISGELANLYPKR